jgi:hypothetical protein
MHPVIGENNYGSPRPFFHIYTVWIIIIINYNYEGFKFRKINSFKECKEGSTKTISNIETEGIGM